MPAKLEVPAFGLIRMTPRVGHRLHYRDQHVGEDRADDEIHLRAIDQCLRLVDRDIGLKLVVFDDNLHFATTELTAKILDGELESVAQLLSEHRRWAGKRRNDAYFDLVLRAGRRSRKSHDGADQRELLMHVPLLRVIN